VTWVSFLFQPVYRVDDPDLAVDFNVFLRNGSTDVVNLNKARTNDNYRLGTTNTGISAMNNDVQFFVLRIDHGTAGQNDASVHLFVNPDIASTAPPFTDAVAAHTGLAGGAVNFDAIRFNTPSGGLPSFEQKFRFDEIRVASDYGFASGIPEPSALGVIGAGALLLMRRMRRQASGSC
jgi:hypothetical protein